MCREVVNNMARTQDVSGHNVLGLEDFGYLFHWNIWKNGGCPCLAVYEEGKIPYETQLCNSSEG